MIALLTDKYVLKIVIVLDVLIILSTILKEKKLNYKYRQEIQGHLNKPLKDVIAKNQDVKKNIVNVIKTIYNVHINVDVKDV